MDGDQRRLNFSVLLIQVNGFDLNLSGTPQFLNYKNAEMSVWVP